MRGERGVPAEDMQATLQASAPPQRRPAPTQVVRVDPTFSATAEPVTSTAPHALPQRSAIGPVTVALPDGALRRARLLASVDRAELTEGREVLVVPLSDGGTVVVGALEPDALDALLSAEGGTLRAVPR